MNDHNTVAHVVGSVKPAKASKTLNMVIGMVAVLLATVERMIAAAQAKADCSDDNRVFYQDLQLLEGLHDALLVVQNLVVVGFEQHSQEHNQHTVS